jgi:hypothetical protein
MIYIPGQVNQTKKACWDAAEIAQKFMGKLFSGERCAKCECGREVVYRDGKIICEDCGKNLDAVGYVQKYGDIFIKTTVFVDQKRFRLGVSSENDFDE